jgi:serine O-acetyltransferase
MNQPVQRWRDCLLQDWDRYVEAPRSFWRVLRALFYNAGFTTVFLYRLYSELRTRGWIRVSRLARRLNLILSACDLSPQAQVEPGLLLPHPYCVTIDFTIYQGAVLGARTVRTTDGSNRAEYPSIGDGVVVYPNALIYGGIRIGDGAEILGNSVVTCDVPPGAVFGGIPAREIKPTSKN